MGEQSKIEWTDSTWNPWRGCRPVSPGCENCYAETLVDRFHGKGAFRKRVRSGDATFNAPLKWDLKPWVCDACGAAHGSGALAAYGEKQICAECGWKEATFHRRRVFSLSLGDWLDDEVPIEWLADMLSTIYLCKNLDFLLLTKRPENFQKRLLHAGMEMMGYVDGQKSTKPEAFATVPDETIEMVLGWSKLETCPSNVWIGATVENQEQADKRIPELLKIPAVCRFVSYEPALGPVDFSQWLPDQDSEQDTTAFHNFHHPEDGLHWIIVGGESGPGARPFNVEWARITIAQCRAAGVAVFCKQLGAVVQHRNDAGFEGDEGEWPMDTHTNHSYFDPGIYQGKPVRVLLRDKKGGDMSEWPVDLRVREFPNIRHGNHFKSASRVFRKPIETH